MGEFLEIAKVMVQPTMKLLEMCGNAIGTMYQPRHMRKMTDAEVYRIKQLGNAIIETDGLPIAYDNGEISMNTLNLEDFAKRAELRVNHQMLREQNNIESVVGKAYQELLNTPEVPSDPVDEDWTTRFFNIVKEINTEEMQFIWSKILAGEITQPGSFSMRTLETIRNLSKNEAEVFQKIVPCIVITGNDYLLSSDSEVYEKYGIKFSDIMKLDECGLMTSSGSLSLTQTITGESEVIVYNGALVMVTNGSNEKPTKVRYGIHTLTSAGKELYRTLSCTPNREYFLSFAEHTFKENKGINFTVHNITSIDKSVISYEKAIVREFCEKKGAVE